MKRGTLFNLITRIGEQLNLDPLPNELTLKATELYYQGKSTIGEIQAKIVHEHKSNQDE